MMNRLRTALVSVTAVAVAMMVLGSDARAKSVPAASPQNYLSFNYLSFLEQLAQGEIHSGDSLIQGLSSLERTMNILENTLKNTYDPSPWLVQGITTLEKTIYNHELMDFSNIKKDINVLLGTQTLLQGEYQILQAQKEALLSAGWVYQARLVATQQGQVFNLENSVHGLIVAERGVATPIR